MPSKNDTQTKLRIAYLLDDTLDKPDGVQQCVITIGEHMRSLGHEVHYIVAESRRSDLLNVYPLAKFVSMKFNGNSVRTPLPVSKQRIIKLLDELDINVLHVQMPFSPFFAAKVILACTDKVKIVGTWHTFPTGGLQEASHKPLSLAIRKALKRVETTIGVSLPTAEFADKVYKTKSIVIPNAVDISRFKVYGKKGLLKRIVFLGRFDERKGPIYLIEALGYMNTIGSLPEVEVVMGGKGPDLVKCMERAKELGLAKIISFPGFVDEADKAKLLASADVSVFPSTGGEAFGISIVEAMASGQSIVLGGDNPGYRSILGDKPELLFDPKDIQNFASKLIHYLNLNEKESVIKKKWLKDAAIQYDVNNVCDELLKLYVKDLGSDDN